MIKLQPSCYLLYIICSYVSTQYISPTQSHDTLCLGSSSCEDTTQGQNKVQMPLQPYTCPENDPSLQACSCAHNPQSEKIISLAGYDEQIYQIIKDIQQYSYKHDILVTFYLYQNGRLHFLGNLMTSLDIFQYVLGKHQHYFCINEDNIHRFQDASSGWCVNNVVVIPSHKESAILNVLANNFGDGILNKYVDYVDHTENRNRNRGVDYPERQPHQIDCEGQMSGTNFENDEANKKLCEFNAPGAKHMIVPPINVCQRNKEEKHQTGSNNQGVCDVKNLKRQATQVCPENWYDLKPCTNALKGPVCNLNLNVVVPRRPAVIASFGSTTDSSYSNHICNTGMFQICKTGTSSSSQSSTQIVPSCLSVWSPMNYVEPPKTFNLFKESAIPCLSYNEDTNTPKTVNLNKVDYFNVQPTAYPTSKLDIYSKGVNNIPTTNLLGKNENYEDKTGDSKMKTYVFDGSKHNYVCQNSKLIMPYNSNLYETKPYVSPKPSISPNVDLSSNYADADTSTNVEVLTNEYYNQYQFKNTLLNPYALTPTEEETPNNNIVCTQQKINYWPSYYVNNKPENYKDLNLNFSLNKENIYQPNIIPYQFPNKLIEINQLPYAWPNYYTNMKPDNHKGKNLNLVLSKRHNFPLNIKALDSNMYPGVICNAVCPNIVNFDDITKYPSIQTPVIEFRSPMLPNYENVKPCKWYTKYLDQNADHSFDRIYLKPKINKNKQYEFHSPRPAYVGKDLKVTLSNLNSKLNKGSINKQTSVWDDEITDQSQQNKNLLNFSPCQNNDGSATVTSVFTDPSKFEQSYSSNYNLQPCAQHKPNVIEPQEALYEPVEINQNNSNPKVITPTITQPKTSSTIPIAVHFRNKYVVPLKYAQPTLPITFEEPQFKIPENKLNYFYSNPCEYIPSKKPICNKPTIISPLVQPVTQPKTIVVPLDTPKYIQIENYLHPNYVQNSYHAVPIGPITQPNAYKNIYESCPSLLPITMPQHQIQIPEVLKPNPLYQNLVFPVNYQNLNKPSIISTPLVQPRDLNLVLTDYNYQSLNKPAIILTPLAQAKKSDKGHILETNDILEPYMSTEYLPDNDQRYFFDQAYAPINLSDGSKNIDIPPVIDAAPCTQHNTFPKITMPSTQSVTAIPELSTNEPQEFIANKHPNVIITYDDSPKPRFPNQNNYVYHFDNQPSHQLPSPKVLNHLQIKSDLDIPFNTDMHLPAPYVTISPTPVDPSFNLYPTHTTPQVHPTQLNSSPNTEMLDNNNNYYETRSTLPPIAPFKSYSQIKPAKSDFVTSTLYPTPKHQHYTYTPNVNKQSQSNKEMPQICKTYPVGKMVTKPLANVVTENPLESPPDGYYSPEKGTAITYTTNNKFPWPSYINSITLDTEPTYTPFVSPKPLASKYILPVLRTVPTKQPKFYHPKVSSPPIDVQLLTLPSYSYTPMSPLEIKPTENISPLVTPLNPINYRRRPNIIEFVPKPQTSDRKYLPPHYIKYKPSDKTFYVSVPSEGQHDVLSKNTDDPTKVEYLAEPHSPYNELSSGDDLQNISPCNLNVKPIQLTVAPVKIESNIPLNPNNFWGAPKNIKFRPYVQASNIKYAPTNYLKDVSLPHAKSNQFNDYVPSEPVNAKYYANTCNLPINNLRIETPANVRSDNGEVNSHNITPYATREYNYLPNVYPFSNTPYTDMTSNYVVNPSYKPYKQLYQDTVTPFIQPYQEPKEYNYSPNMYSTSKPPSIETAANFVVNPSYKPHTQFHQDTTTPFIQRKYAPKEYYYSPNVYPILDTPYSKTSSNYVDIPSYQPHTQLYQDMTTPYIQPCKDTLKEYNYSPDLYPISDTAYSNTASNYVHTQPYQDTTTPYNQPCQDFSDLSQPISQITSSIKPEITCLPTYLEKPEIPSRILNSPQPLNMPIPSPCIWYSNKVFIPKQKIITKPTFLPYSPQIQTYLSLPHRPCFTVPSYVTPHIVTPNFDILPSSPIIYQPQNLIIPNQTPCFSHKKVTPPPEIVSKPYVDSNFDVLQNPSYAYKPVTQPCAYLPIPSSNGPVLEPPIDDTLIPYEPQNYSPSQTPLNDDCINQAVKPTHEIIENVPSMKSDLNILPDITYESQTASPMTYVPQNQYAIIQTPCQNVYSNEVYDKPTPAIILQKPCVHNNFNTLRDLSWVPKIKAYSNIPDLDSISPLKSSTITLPSTKPNIIQVAPTPTTYSSHDNAETFKIPNELLPAISIIPSVDTISNAPFIPVHTQQTYQDVHSNKVPGPTPKIIQIEPSVDHNLNTVSNFISYPNIQITQPYKDDQADDQLYTGFAPLEYNIPTPVPYAPQSSDIPVQIPYQIVDTDILELESEIPKEVLYTLAKPEIKPTKNIPHVNLPIDTSILTSPTFSNQILANIPRIASFTSPNHVPKQYTSLESNFKPYESVLSQPTFGYPLHTMGYSPKPQTNQKVCLAKPSVGIFSPINANYKPPSSSRTMLTLNKFKYLVHKQPASLPILHFITPKTYSESNVNSEEFSLPHIWPYTYPYISQNPITVSEWPKVNHIKSESLTKNGPYSYYQSLTPQYKPGLDSNTASYLSSPDPTQISEVTSPSETLYNSQTPLYTPQTPSYVSQDTSYTLLAPSHINKTPTFLAPQLKPCLYPETVKYNSVTQPYVNTFESPILTYQTPSYTPRPTIYTSQAPAYKSQPCSHTSQLNSFTPQVSSLTPKESTSIPSTLTPQYQPYSHLNIVQYSSSTPQPCKTSYEPQLSYTHETPSYTPVTPLFKPLEPVHAPQTPLYTPQVSLYTPKTPIYTPQVTLYTPRVHFSQEPLSAPMASVYSPQESLYTPLNHLYTSKALTYTCEVPISTSKASELSPQQAIYTNKAPVYTPHSFTPNVPVHTSQESLHTAGAPTYTKKSLYFPTVTALTSKETVYTPKAPVYTPPQVLQTTRTPTYTPQKFLFTPKIPEYIPLVSTPRHAPAGFLDKTYTYPYIPRPDITKPQCTPQKPSFTPQAPKYILQEPSYTPKAESLYTPQAPITPEELLHTSEISKYIPKTPTYYTPQAPTYIAEEPSFISQVPTYTPQVLSYTPSIPSYIPQKSTRISQAPTYIPQITSYTQKAPIITKELSYTPQAPTYIHQEPSYYISQVPTCICQTPTYTPQVLYTSSIPTYTPQELSYTPQAPTYIPQEILYTQQDPTNILQGPINTLEASTTPQELSHTPQIPSYTSQEHLLTPKEPTYQEPSYTAQTPTYTSQGPINTLQAPQTTFQIISYTPSVPTYTPENVSYTTQAPTYQKHSYTPQTHTYTSQGPINTLQAPQTTFQVISYTPSVPTYTPENVSYTTQAPTYIPQEPVYIAKAPTYTSHSPSYISQAPTYYTSQGPINTLPAPSYTPQVLSYTLQTPTYNPQSLYTPKYYEYITPQNISPVSAPQLDSYSNPVTTKYSSSSEQPYETLYSPNLPQVPAHILSAPSFEPQTLMYTPEKSSHTTEQSSSGAPTYSHPLPSHPLYSYYFSKNNEPKILKQNTPIVSFQSSPDSTQEVCKPESFTAWLDFSSYTKYPSNIVPESSPHVTQSFAIPKPIICTAPSLPILNLVKSQSPVFPHLYESTQSPVYSFDNAENKHTNSDLLPQFYPAPIRPNFIEYLSKTWPCYPTRIPQNSVPVTPKTTPNVYFQYYSQPYPNTAYSTVTNNPEISEARHYVASSGPQNSYTQPSPENISPVQPIPTILVETPITEPDIPFDSFYDNIPKAPYLFDYNKYNAYTAPITNNIPDIEVKPTPYILTPTTYSIPNLQTYPHKPLAFDAHKTVENLQYKTPTTLEDSKISPNYYEYLDSYEFKDSIPQISEICPEISIPAKPKAIQFYNSFDPTYKYKYQPSNEYFPKSNIPSPKYSIWPLVSKINQSYRIPYSYQDSSQLYPQQTKPKDTEMYTVNPTIEPNKYNSVRSYFKQDQAKMFPKQYNKLNTFEVNKIPSYTNIINLQAQKLQYKPTTYHNNEPSNILEYTSTSEIKPQSDFYKKIRYKPTWYTSANRKDATSTTYQTQSQIYPPRVYTPVNWYTPSYGESSNYYEFNYEPQIKSNEYPSKSILHDTYTQQYPVVEESTIDESNRPIWTQKLPTFDPNICLDNVQPNIVYSNIIKETPLELVSTNKQSLEPYTFTYDSGKTSTTVSPLFGLHPSTSKQRYNYNTNEPYKTVNINPDTVISTPAVTVFNTQNEIPESLPILDKYYNTHMPQTCSQTFNVETDSKLNHESSYFNNFWPISNYKPEITVCDINEKTQKPLKEPVPSFSRMSYGNTNPYLSYYKTQAINSNIYQQTAKDIRYSPNEISYIYPTSLDLTFEKLSNPIDRPYYPCRNYVSYTYSQPRPYYTELPNELTVEPTKPKIESKACSIGVSNMYPTEQQYNYISPSRSDNIRPYSYPPIISYTSYTPQELSESKENERFTVPILNTFKAQLGLTYPQSSQYQTSNTAYVTNSAIAKSNLYDPNYRAENSPSGVSSYPYNWQSYNNLKPFSYIPNYCNTLAPLTENFKPHSVKQYTPVFTNHVCPEHINAERLAIKNLLQSYPLNKINNYQIIEKLSKDKEEAIDLGNVCLVKHPVDQNTVLLKTNDPRIYMKTWKSKIKVIRAKIVLDESEYDVTNFMPVVKEPHLFDFEEVQNVVKDIVRSKYGEPIVLKGVYNMYNPYAVSCNIDAAKLNAGANAILWPTLDENLLSNVRNII